MWITGRDGGVGEHNYVGKELENFLSHRERIELTEKVERGNTLAHFGRTPGIMGCVKLTFSVSFLRELPTHSGNFRASFLSLEKACFYNKKQPLRTLKNTSLM